MKAWTVKKPAALDSIQLIDLPDPGAPGAGEIRVALHATSLNYHDLLVATGAIPVADGRILMADGAGVVEDVGDGVNEFSVGDSVVACFFPQWPDGKAQRLVADFSHTPGDGVDGFASQYVVRPASHFTLAPHGWSFKQAATITTSGLTAWRALVVEGKLKAGDTVLTLGTGGVSMTALQLAKSMGAQVIVTSSSDEKLARARQLGADHTINYRTTPQWGAAVQDIAGNHGADIIVELGGPGTLAHSFEAVSMGGCIALIGVLTGFEGQVPTHLLMTKQARLQGVVVGNRRQQQEYVKALNQNTLHPVIDKVFALAELPEAFRYQQSGAHFGKICLEW
ncbi:NAD(P)-dependent alcohol dehydrogenase [Klebsiella aerogenes]|nr:NAD(P)-dependent alcohol dehydrogenase [Klebsiella aerogenes]